MGINLRFFQSLFLSLLLSFATLALGQVDKGVSTIEDFPVYKDTGNPQKDDNEYAQKKKEWYINHPEEFRKANPSLSNPNQVPIIARENPKAIVFEPIVDEKRNQEVGQVGVFYINNGGLDQSEAYAKVDKGQNSANLTPLPIMDNKPLEILTEPRQKLEMIPPYLPSQNTEQQEIPVMPITENILAPAKETALPNDYPKYVDTGNAQQDQQRYDTAKQAWIAANPNAYAKLNARNKQLIDKQEFEQMPAEKRQHILQNPDLYFIGEGQK